MAFTKLQNWVEYGTRRLYCNRASNMLSACFVKCLSEFFLRFAPNWIREMEEDCDCFSVEESDPEIYPKDVSGEEDPYYTSSSLPKIQPRADPSKAQWNDVLRMAEVVDKKGKHWVTTGIVRGSKTFCSIEETLFLVEEGALYLTDPHGVCISLKQLYAKVTEEWNGSCSEIFEVYKHLKTLGYIVGRHGVPWTMKSVKNRSNFNPSQDASTNLEMKEIESENVKSIEEMLRNLQTDEPTPAFDIYLPNSRFRKSSPGDPDFVIIFFRGNHPPSIEKIGVVNKQFDGTPLKFCYVKHGRVNSLLIESVNLPLLP